MIFIKNAEDIAGLAMNQSNPLLAERFVELIRFLIAYPECASGLRSKDAPALGSEGYIYADAKNFTHGRDQKRPTPPRNYSR